MRSELCGQRTGQPIHMINGDIDASLLFGFNSNGGALRQGSVAATIKTDGQVFHITIAEDARCFFGGRKIVPANGGADTEGEARREYLHDALDAWLDHRIEVSGK